MVVAVYVVVAAPMQLRLWLWCFVAVDHRDEGACVFVARRD